jgi:hypothetical protein
LLLGIFKEALYRSLALVKVVMHDGVHLDVRALLQYLAELRLVVKFDSKVCVKVELFEDRNEILHIVIFLR